MVDQHIVKEIVSLTLKTLAIQRQRPSDMRSGREARHVEVATKLAGVPDSLAPLIHLAAWWPAEAEKWVDQVLSRVEKAAIEVEAAAIIARGTKRISR